LTISDTNGQQVYQRKVTLKPGEQQLDPIDAGQSALPAKKESPQ
jgi:hypothetical protein